MRITARGFRLAALGIALGPLISGCPQHVAPSVAVAAATTADAGRVRSRPGTMPALPKVVMRVLPVASTGKTILVKAGGNLQGALNDAAPGEVIELQAGQEFTGPFVLPDKAGRGWITVESSDMAKLPAAGTRVGPADSPYMPKLVAASGSVISTDARAHDYRFVGIEITTADAVRGSVPAAAAAKSPRHSFVGDVRSAARGLERAVFRGPPRRTAPLAASPGPVNLVLLGENDASRRALPSHIVFDRCYLLGDPRAGTRRGIAMNSAYTAVINSYLADFKAMGQDSQAIASWNGSGPFLIENDYLQAAGENVMFGGQDPTIKNLVPSNIEILGNDMVKSLTWQSGNSAHHGARWSVKNILELKNARRVLIKGNVLKYNWIQSQDGFGVLFTVRDQDGTAPWSVVRDVTFVDNVLQDSASGVNILGYDDDHPSQQARDILIENNLFTNIGYAGGAGTLFQILDGAADVNIEHNTAQQSGDIIMSGGARTERGFVFEDNIAPENRYGIIGTGRGIGRATLNAYFPGAVVEGNVLIGASANLYQSGNSFPRSERDVGFIDAAAGQLGLSNGSRYVEARSGGSVPGVELARLCAALSRYGALTAVHVRACESSGV